MLAYFPVFRSAPLSASPTPPPTEGDHILHENSLKYIKYSYVIFMQSWGRHPPDEKSACAICISDLISTSLGRQKLPHSAAFGIFVFPSTPAKRRRSGNLLPTHARRAALRLRRNAACGGFAAALCPDRPAGGRGAPRISSVILIPNQYMER